MDTRSDVRLAPSRWSVAAATILAAIIAVHSQAVRAQQPAAQGKWTTLPSQMPINPVHIALLHTGKVLVVAGSGNVAGNTNLQAGIWDPESGSIIMQPLTWDMFCNGMVILPDGRPLINGGTIQYDPFYGQPRNAVFDPATGTFTDVQGMAHGRWYPTVTTLGDGRVMTFSGLKETGGTNTAVEIYTPGVGWSPVPGWVDAAAVSPHAPASRRHRPVLRVGYRVAHLQSVDAHVDRGRRLDQLHGYTDLRHVSSAAAQSVAGLCGEGS